MCWHVNSFSSNFIKYCYPHIQNIFYCFGTPCYHLYFRHHYWKWYIKSINNAFKLMSTCRSVKNWSSSKCELHRRDFSGFHLLVSLLMFTNHCFSLASSEGNLFGKKCDSCCAFRTHIQKVYILSIYTNKAPHLLHASAMKIIKMYIY